VENDECNWKPDYSGCCVPHIMNISSIDFKLATFFKMQDNIVAEIQLSFNGLFHDKLAKLVPECLHSGLHWS